MAFISKQIEFKLRMKHLMQKKLENKMAYTKPDTNSEPTARVSWNSEPRVSWNRQKKRA